jgi:hypothetical protein
LAFETNLEAARFLGRGLLAGFQAVFLVATAETFLTAALAVGCISRIFLGNIDLDHFFNSRGFLLRCRR